MKQVLSFLLCFISVGMFAQVCSYSNLTYKAGESLTYQLSYNVSFVWIPAGEVKFEVFENEEEYFVEVRGKTYESYNSFFKVDDYYSSVIDKFSGRPKTFVRDINEGGYSKYDSISFDHQNFNVSGIIGKQKSRTKPYSMEISDCVHDIISILYALRNVKVEDFQREKKLKFTIFFDQEEYPLTLEYKGVQEKEIKSLGRRKCHYVVPEVVAGDVFDEDSKMSVWVSHDRNLVPLMVESPVSVGSVKAILIDSKNLKYETKKD